MKFNRSNGISTAAVAAIVIVVAIVAAGGAYVASSGSKSTVTATVTSTAISTATGQPATVTATISGTVTTLTLTSTSTSVSTSVSTTTSTTTSTSVSTTTSTSTSTSTSTAVQTTTPAPVLPASLPATSSPISEAGSSLLYPLFQLWAANFTQMYTNVQLNTAAGGSSAGVSGVEANTINLGASDPFLTSAQSTSFPSLLNIAVAVSAQQVNYNVPGIPTTTHLNFTGNVLAGIYNGTITYWDNANIKALQSASVAAELPHLLIVPLHRSDGSGDTNLFTTFLSDSSPDWAKNFGSGNTIQWPSVPAAEADNGNSGMLAGSAQQTGSIAYIGVSYLAQATKDGLGNAALKNAAGNFEQLTTANVQTAVNNQYTATPPNEKISLIYGPGATSYPIVNFEYVIVNQNQANPTLAAQIQAILDYATLPQYGQAAYFLNQVGFVPLPNSIAQLSWAQINSITG